MHLKGDPTPAKFDAGAADSLHQWAARRSFELFSMDFSTRKQLHWQPVSMGWLWNSHYRMRFYSETFYSEWANEQLKLKMADLLRQAKQAQKEVEEKRREALERSRQEAIGNGVGVAAVPIP